MNEDKDIEITCIDCQKPFTFTVSEQKYFKDRGLFQPKRCPACRKIRKARLQNPPQQNNAVDNIIGQPTEPHYHQKEDWRNGGRRPWR